jgi:ankyrin repeat protein
MIIAVAADIDLLTSLLKDGVEGIQVGFSINDAELDEFTYDLAANATLTSLSFVTRLPTARVDTLMVALRKNVTLSEISFAEGEPHEKAARSIVSPSRDEVARLLPLVRGLRLVRTVFNINQLNRRAFVSALSEALREDPSLYPDVVLSALKLVFRGSRYDVRNKKVVSFLFESEHVPAEVKKAVEAYLEDFEDPLASAVFENLFRRVMDAGGDAEGIRLAACQLGASEVVREMVRRGGWSLNEGVGDTNDTPLLLSCYNGHLSTAKALIAAGADVNRADAHGWSPLNLACLGGTLDLLELLLKAGVDTDKTTGDGRSPLYVAAQNQQPAVVSRLLRHGVDIEKRQVDGWTAIHSAAWNGDAEVTRLLLQGGANVNTLLADGRSPLHVAAQLGHVAVMEILLQSGADANEAQDGGPTPLISACWTRRRDVIELLLRAGADVNKPGEAGEAPLFVASEFGLLDSAEHLIQVSGVNLNQPGRMGTTPLFIACANGHTAIIEMLLRAGADMNLAMEDGSTPIFIASFSGEVEAVRLLIEAGADVNKPRHDGDTPFFIASREGHLEIVDLLVQAGADKARSLLYTYFPSDTFTPQMLFNLIVRDFETLPKPRPPLSALQHAAIHSAIVFINNGTARPRALARLIQLIAAKYKDHPTFPLFLSVANALEPNES